MVTNGDHNIFGKLVPGPGKKLVFFQKLVQRARSAHGARSGWRPRGRRSATCTAVQDAGREQGRARWLRGSEAMHSETRARKHEATSTVPSSYVKRSTVPGREANKLNVDDVES